MGVRTMGFFDFCRNNDKKTGDESRENNAKENISAEMAIQTITAMISKDDSTVLKRIKACLEDTEAYFHEYADIFLERGIEEFDQIPLREIQWIAMVDILAEHMYVCERDWKDELDDFLHFIGELKETKAKALPLETEWFDEDGDISEWSAIIDVKWKSSGMCLADIDIESDCYILFPCENDKLNELKTLAKIISCRIDYAKNM